MIPQLPSTASNIHLSQNSNEFPPQILALFTPREEIPFIPNPLQFESIPFEGLSRFMEHFELNNEKPKKELILPKWKEKELNKMEKVEKFHKLRKIQIKEWNPKKDKNVVTDPYNTLFVARLNFETDEKKLKKEFEEFGPIKVVKVVRDLNGKSRGYAFIEFENSVDMKKAYRYSEHKIIDHRPVLVDVERARICLPKWKPRRLGGGLGSTRTAQLKKKERERLDRIARKRKGRRVFGRRGGRGGGGGRFGGGRGRFGGGRGRFGGGRGRFGGGRGRFGGGRGRGGFRGRGRFDGGGRGRFRGGGRDGFRGGGGFRGRDSGGGRDRGGSRYGGNRDNDKFGGKRNRDTDYGSRKRRRFDTD